VWPAPAAPDNPYPTHVRSTPGNTADDFHPTFTGGDTNGNGLLDLGETWMYTATVIVQAGASDPLVNVAVVTAKVVGFPNTVTATDGFAVNLFQASIRPRTR